MYNIIQLNDKDLSELQQIAKELGLKNQHATQEELVYCILGRTSLSSVQPKRRQLPKQTKNAEGTAAQRLVHQRKKRRRQSVHSN